MAYPNIEKIQQLKPSGSIHVTGPLDDEDDPEPGLLKTYVFATVAQPGQTSEHGVNALAVRIYTKGNVDTVSWSRWVQLLAGPAPS